MSIIYLPFAECYSISSESQILILLNMEAVIDDSVLSVLIVKVYSLT